MRLSACNLLQGWIVGLDTDIGVVTASITNAAAAELEPAVGDTALAVIKASDVMVARPRPDP